MKVFVAGASGAVGRRIVRDLLERGHEVVGLTRSRDKAAELAEAGVHPVIGDVLDAVRMKELVAEVSPDAIVQVLNALPKRGPMRPGELSETNTLRTKGTRHLVEAAAAAGVRRFVAESMIFGYGFGRFDHPVSEDQPFVRDAEWPSVQPTFDGLNALEDQVLEATRRGELEGVVLRFGLFYGPGVGSTDFMIRMLRRRAFKLPGSGDAVGSWIHIDDAAAATVEALERAPAGSVFNVVDDQPATLREFSVGVAEALGLPRPGRVPLWMTRLAGRYLGSVAKSRLPVSNERIKRELGWAPRYPSYREGVATLGK